MLWSLTGVTESQGGRERDPLGKSLGPIRSFHLVWSVICLATLLCFVQANPVSSAEKHLRLKRGQTSICVRGQFTKQRPELYYTVYAHAGQQMRVEIVPMTADLHTQGSVK